MKKNIVIFSVLALFVALCASCQQNTYSDLQKNEKKLIADFIEREHINIIYEEPKDDVWGEKDYLDMTAYGFENMYFHLVSRGDSTAGEVKSGDVIVLRYRQYTLNVNADTISYWTTSDNGYPREFKYLTDQTNSCSGWHAAVMYMKYSGSEAKIINPSKLDFDDAVETVTPHGYDLKIKIKK